MSHAGAQTNGASLEDCHANFFALTDVCGIRWIVFRESDCPSGTAKAPNGSDAVLSSFAKCLEADLLAVWRRVPRRALLSCNYDMMSQNKGLSNAEEAAYTEKNPVTQRKELWIFWYGDKPDDQFKRHVNPDLKEVPDISGTWENVLPYEARTLLYKALNNLIERNLLSKDFVRLGKWFVQPFEGPEKTLQKASHLSFSFQYFVHGESFVCASVDVRQHPAVRRLGPHHLSLSRAAANPVPVILAPYGLAATLTGVTFKSSDVQVSKLLQDWKHFYPLDRNRYFCQDSLGDIVTMAPAVEVVVAGVKMVYPTCYVLVTDLDTPHTFSQAGGSPTKLRPSEVTTSSNDVFNYVEPSPFTTSNHPLLSDLDLHILPPSVISQTEQVWQDGLSVDPESTLSSSEQQQNQYHQQLGLNTSSSDLNASSSTMMAASDLVSAWDLSNPGRFVKKKPKSKMREKSSKDHRNRFNSKVPFHKKAETIDELAWILDQSDMLGGGGASSGSNNGNNNNNNRHNMNSSQIKSQQPSLVSPASGSVGGPVTPLGAITPKGGPGSVRTPGGVDLMSPHAPPSNGPLTPMDMDSKQPSTPKSVPSYPVPSPFMGDRKPAIGGPTSSEPNPIVKSEILQSALQQPQQVSATTAYYGAANSIKGEPTSEGEEQMQQPHVNSSGSFKRPALPTKEYEDGLETEQLLSDTILDTESIRSWLNHPVKRFKPTDLKSNDPLKPLYRRQSQADVLLNVEAVEQPGCGGGLKGEPVIKQEVDQNGLGGPGRLNIFGDLYDFDGRDGHDKRENGPAKNPDDDSLFTSKGLQPSIDDLENIFDDSSDETEGNGVVPTPPGSNKPAAIPDEPDGAFTKLQKQGSKVDPIGNLPHDQLAKMFPTPPSLEHPSPADGTLEADHGHMKMEPFSPAPDLTDWWTGGEDFDYSLASSKFAPLPRLYSDSLAPINAPSDFKYKPQRNRIIRGRGGLPHHAAPSMGTPGSNMKTGMSPASVEGGPRSHHSAGVSGFHPGNHDLASPASVSSSHNLNRSLSNVDPPMASVSKEASARIPEASSLMLNLILSDTILNVFRDHNFDSCTICVCSNEGNIRGRDVASYLPNFSPGDDDINCICGFSALMNRKLAHQSGLFYEDETEITGITEDLYHRKKASLLLLDPKYNPNEDNDNNNQERANLVDSIPPSLLELIQEQSVYNITNGQNALLKHTKQYLRSTTQPPAISMVDLMDTNYVAFNCLAKVKSISDSGKLDEAQKGTCVHRWTLMQAQGPYCSEDIIRVMKSIQPLLNDSLHVKKAKEKADASVTQQAVQGPLTWRQFHRMAGSTTKGNTDDQCEPLPVPIITVGHEQDFLNVAPQALHYWEAMSLEPFAQQRDVAYIVLAPESEFMLGKVKSFFKSLSSVYESSRLGRHVPITKVLRDGILKVGKKYADKLTNENADPWFEMIGESSSALLLKLYSQVCRHYLMPLLHQLPLDRSLIESSSVSQKQVLVEKTPPSPMPPPSMTNSSDIMMGGSGNNLNNDLKSCLLNKSDSNDDLLGKENVYNAPETNLNDDDADPPAVVIYIIDPFSFGPASDNIDAMRMSTLGLLRCFSQMLPNMGETLKSNLYLQLVSLDSVLEITQSQTHARMPSMMRGLAFSVFSQARRPLHYQKEAKTLTGFGPASVSEKYLTENKDKITFVRPLHNPAFILAQASSKKKIGSDSESFGSSNEKSSVLFVNYCLSEDQHWLLASCCDDRGELVKTITINIEIPNKTRRKKASARRVGLRKLVDWILTVMSMSLVPWRLVIGRIGRIGHGELRGWSVLLSRKALKRASRELRDLCQWKSEVPCILSACLVSMEPDSHLRLMSDQYTPDERFGQNASNCQLSTPKDASCTHVLVFPTSAKAQSSQKEFNDHRDETNEDLGDVFGLPDLDMDPNDEGLQIGDIDDIKDLFSDDNWGDNGGQPESPGSPGMRNMSSQPNSPGGQNTGSDQFKYDQEEPDERIEILQQPLALGYMVSTAKTGPMPRWFWASCPHLEHTSPVFLKSALHINVASLIHGGDDGFPPQGSSGRVHSLDSTYTADVLRYVLEGYNALSWLSLDFETQDRRSCLPLHVQALLQMYNSLAALV